MKRSDIINRLNQYQYEKYIKPKLKERKMQLAEIRIECNHCKVWFTPSNDRAKELMSTYGHISKCKDCNEKRGE